MYEHYFFLYDVSISVLRLVSIFYTCTAQFSVLYGHCTSYAFHTVRTTNGWKLHLDFHAQLCLGNIAQFFCNISLPFTAQKYALSFLLNALKLSFNLLIKTENESFPSFSSFYLPLVTFRWSLDLTVEIELNQGGELMCI